MLTDLKDPTECRCLIDSRDVIAAIRRKETSAILVEDIPRGIEFCFKQTFSFCLKKSVWLPITLYTHKGNIPSKF